MQSSTACQSRSLVSENAAVPSLHVPIVVDEFCLPVKVSPCRSLLAASPNLATSQPFEHSSAKMGSLDIQPLYSTLCPSIKSTRSTSNFHSNMLQYSLSSLVMLDTITYGQDCT